MTNPYATWDENLQFMSDEPDGMPDRKMVELIATLRKRGIVTLQSCAGHSGYSDGHLYIRANTVSDRKMINLSQDPFCSVHKRFWPDEQWEFRWDPAFQHTAIARLMTIDEPDL